MTEAKPAALKLFARTLREGCDTYASSASSKQKQPKYLSVVVSGGKKHDRFWLQGTVVALREKQSFVLDDGTATLLVRAQNCPEALPSRAGQYMMAVVQLSRKNGHATALQLFDLTPQVALREPLWMLEVPDCWASECE